MSRHHRSPYPGRILSLLVLALSAWVAACAEGTQTSSSGSGTTSTGGSGTSTAGNGGTAGSGGTSTGGNTGGGGTSTGGGGTSTGGTGGTSTGGGGMSTGGSSGSGGAVVGGGGAGGCGVEEKFCFNICVPTADPTFGCEDPSCAPCSDAHALPGCVGGACSVLKCDAGWANCDDDAANGCEVNLPIDPLNCGACGAVCVVPHAKPACEGGFCTIGACEMPWSDCDGIVASGCETNVLVDPGNCGMCGVTCAPGEQCEAGVCGVFCPPGKANCDGDALNGCEVDLGTISDCAFCADACNLAHATPDCQAGACTIVACASGFEDCNQISDDGCEADLQGSASSCGGCGQVCPSGPNSTPTCTAGACGLVCAGGYENCNNDPTDGCEQPTLTDPSNCGGCSNVCVTPNATPGCAAGLCKISTCNPGFADCDLLVATGCEISLGSDVAHCGSCGTACPVPPNASPTCTGGACGFTCNAGFADCDGAPANGCEVNLQNDPTHCGACPNVCNLANASQACNGGVCTIGACNAGFANCDGLVVNGCEINLQNDPTHCGSCPNACNLANASQLCNGGVCKIGACNAPFADCDGLVANGCEVNTDSSVASCGACDQPCVVPNGSPACAGGQCLVASCDAGHANCNNQVADGCEVSLQIDTANCGACGNACSLANSVEACNSGACAIASCDAGFGNCDNQTANGCEINLGTNVGNCGTCGNTCNLANAAQACSGGACAIGSCNAGFGDCDNQVANGCETNLNTTVTSCGTCGNTCNLPNSAEACNNGACAIGSCDAGFGNCDNQTANGCEINLGTNVGNCGTCGNACNLANSAEACNSGACAIASCDAGFGNCDNQTANGCEINLDTNAGNCGTCGNTCNLANASQACSGGACAIGSCNAGFGNCDNQVANGCETNLNTTVTSCGTCGNTCNLPNSAEACNNGACAIGTCDAGFGNCDNQTANGCEINLGTNVGNCGTCGNACNLANASQACSGGACAIGSCDAGFGNCDNQVANGCETNLDTTVTSCGTCGNACSFANAGASCSSGTCALGTCASGFGNCDNQAANGCETNLDTTVTSCGSCGNACNLPNATPSCSGGACAVSSCSMPFANCNAQPADGCEVNLTTNVLNCGGCGNVCNLPNAVPSCSSGLCAVATCQPGFSDCDGIAANGCEVDIANGIGNCGGCGIVCSPSNATGVCTAGTCQVATCNAGFSNCNGLPVDGCEVNTQTSVGNCGGCGQICAPANSTGQCSAGTCVIGSCNAGYSNCNGSQADGCEINTSADVQNCGTCGNNCAVSCAGNTALTQCNSGACVIQSCQGGYFNVDGLCSGGCECQASGVSQSCSTPASLGTINVGQAPITTSANLVPLGVEAWYTVTFTGNTNASYHPHVKLTVNPGSAYQFDIRSNCAGGTLSCGVEGGVSNGVTDWETFNGAGSVGYYDVIPPVGNNGTILIHVFRKAGQPLSCSPFTLQISN